MLDPRLIGTKEAARYCGVSVQYLQANYPGKQIQIGSRSKWDRKILDLWIDEMSGLVTKEPTKSNALEEYDWK